jgi:hypothetical protein
VMPKLPASASSIPATIFFMPPPVPVGFPVDDSANGGIGRAAQHLPDRALRAYLIASGLIGEPTAPVIGSAGATNRNSYTLSAAQSSARSLR